MRKMLFVSSIAALAIMLPRLALADDTASLQATKDIGKKIDEGFNTNKPDIIGKVFSEDAIWVAPDGKVTKGRANIQALYASFMKAGFKDHLGTPTEAHALGDTVYVYGTWSLTTPPAKDGSTGKMTGNWSATDVMEGGELHIKMLTVSVPPPPPPKT